MKFVVDGAFGLGVQGIAVVVGGTVIAAEGAAVEVIGGAAVALAPVAAPATLSVEGGCLIGELFE